MTETGQLSQQASSYFTQDPEATNETDQVAPIQLEDEAAEEAFTSLLEKHNIDPQSPEGEKALDALRSMVENAGFAGEDDPLSEEEIEKIDNMLDNPSEAPDAVKEDLDVILALLAAMGNDSDDGSAEGGNEGQPKPLPRAASNPPQDQGTAENPHSEHGSFEEATDSGYDETATASGTGESAQPREATGEPTPEGEAKTPTQGEFKTIEPGEGPAVVLNEEGYFEFNEVVDDSFLPEDVKTGMKAAIDENFDKLPFFQEYFETKGDAYQYMVHMANLESGGGASLENSQDAAGTGGGSAGYMHLHTTFGFEAESYGQPLNTEGWTVDEALNDYEKYTTLTMRALNNNYENAGGGSGQEPLELAMSQWWTGTQSASAGQYYISALSAGSGVNHNTGSVYS